MKKIFFFLLVAVLGLFLPSKIFASDEFDSKYNVTYRLSDNGTANVTQEISLTNKISRVYATEYTLKLQGVEVKNVRAYDGLGELRSEVNSASKETTIHLTFNQQVVGVGATLTFTVNYDIVGGATKKGQVWELTIPKLSGANDIDNYTLYLFTPVSFGNPAFVRPQPVEQKNDGENNIFRFTKNQVINSGVIASFGNFQVFDFNLTYHLDNPDLENGYTLIALPPDTGYQQIHYSSLSPKPVSVSLDKDGNWLAKYNLSPKQRLEVVAKGFVKIFSENRDEFPPFARESLKDNLGSSKYWPTEDPVIKKLAADLKTPKAIYDYVVRTLNYDFDRVFDNPERLGAVGAINNPDSAICMEFTDLFVALARAAGIPAREINGYAYTTNEKLRPLGVSSDVLHSWPEYWNEEKSLWVPVDPTWEKTTGGVDYFSRTDLSHFAFVIHGKDSEYPYPAGAYKDELSQSKDVDVAFGEFKSDYENTQPQLNVDFGLPSLFIRERGGAGSITIDNNGGSAVYNLLPHINSQSQAYSFLYDKSIIPVLPPFTSVTMPITILATKFFSPREDTIVVQASGQTFSHGLKAASIPVSLIVVVIGIVVIGLVFLTRPWKYVKKFSG